MKSRLRRPLFHFPYKCLEFEGTPDNKFQNDLENGSMNFSQNSTPGKIYCATIYDLVCTDRNKHSSCSLAFSSFSGFPNTPIKHSHLLVSPVKTFYPVIETN